MNSAMNALLYSKLIGQCMSRARKFATGNLSVDCSCHVGNATKFDVTEQVELKEIQTTC